MAGRLDGDLFLPPEPRPWVRYHVRAVARGNVGSAIDAAGVDDDDLIGEGGAGEAGLDLIGGIQRDDGDREPFSHAGIVCENARMPRILIIKTSSMGDVIHNLPIITDIHAHVPDVVVDWLVEEGFADLPRLHPGVSDIIPVALRRWRHSWYRRSVWREMRAFRDRLRSREYDLVLDTQCLLKSAVLARLARGTRCGLDADSAREPFAARFYEHRCHVPWRQHAVARTRALAACALDYPIPAGPPDFGIVAPTRPPELPRDYVVCLHATSWDSKRWPQRHWVDLCARLLDRGSTPLLPWGNAAERARADEIARAVPGARVLPPLALRELAAILGGARAVIGVDTGLVHLAAALDRPTVALYIDTFPELTGVLAHTQGRALNLGGKGQVPGVETVMEALADVEPISSPC